MKVSILLLTFNEELNLPRCLDALTWCDDVVAIDSGSSDRTLQILESRGVRILSRGFDNFAAQRNFGLVNGMLKYEWVLHLDADEVVTPELKAEINNIEPDEDLDGYYVPAKTMLFGQWLKYAGMWPSYQARLGHRERMHFIQVGHGQREKTPPSRMGTLQEPYLHYNFSHGMTRWLEKHIRYARDEARLLAESEPKPLTLSGGVTSGRRRLKRLAASVPLFLRPLARFLYVFLWRQGFRDGRAGLAYAVMLAVYEGMISVFSYEALLAGNTERSAARNVSLKDKN